MIPRSPVTRIPKTSGDHASRQAERWLRRSIACILATISAGAIVGLTAGYYQVRSHLAAKEHAESLRPQILQHLSSVAELIDVPRRQLASNTFDIPPLTEDSLVVLDLKGIHYATAVLRDSPVRPRSRLAVDRSPALFSDWDRAIELMRQHDLDQIETNELKQYIELLQVGDDPAVGLADVRQWTNILRRPYAIVIRESQVRPTVEGKLKPAVDDTICHDGLLVDTRRGKVLAAARMVSDNPFEDFRQTFLHPDAYEKRLVSICPTLADLKRTFSMLSAVKHTIQDASIAPVTLCSRQNTIVLTDTDVEECLRCFVQIDGGAQSDLDRIDVPVRFEDGHLRPLCNFDRQGMVDTLLGTRSGRRDDVMEGTRAFLAARWYLLLKQSSYRAAGVTKMDGEVSSFDQGGVSYDVWLVDAVTERVCECYTLSVGNSDPFRVAWNRFPSATAKNFHDAFAADLRDCVFGNVATTLESVFARSLDTGAKLASAKRHCEKAVDRLRQAAWDAAIEEASWALMTVPDDTCAWEIRGLAFLQQEDEEKAIADAERVLAVTDQSALAHAIRSAVLFRKGEFQQAREESRRAIELDSQCALGHAQMALIDFQTGQTSTTALAAARRACELNPDLPDGNEALAAILCLSGELEEASQALVALQRRKPISTRNAWLAETVAEAHALSPQVPPALRARFTRCLALLHHGDLAAAREVASELLSASPQCRELVRTLALVCERSGDETNAFDLFEEANRLPLAPVDESSHQPESSDPTRDTIGVQSISKSIEQTVSRILKERLVDALESLGVNGGYVSTCRKPDAAPSENEPRRAIYFPDDVLETRVWGDFLRVAYCVRDRQSELRPLTDWDLQIASNLRDAVPEDLADQLGVSQWDLRVGSPVAAVRIDRNHVRVHVRLAVLVRRRQTANEANRPYLFAQEDQWQAVVDSTEVDLPAPYGEMHEIVDAMTRQVTQYRRMDLRRLEPPKYTVAKVGENQKGPIYQIIVKSDESSSERCCRVQISETKDGCLYTLLERDETKETDDLVLLHFAEKYPPLTKTRVREGWPQCVPAEEFDEEQLQSQNLYPLVTLTSGHESAIEAYTADPYERLFLLALCWQRTSVDPISLPLDETLVSFGGPPFPDSHFGLNCLDFIHATTLCEQLLGINTEALEINESDSLTVREMARRLAGADERAGLK